MRYSTEAPTGGHKLKVCGRKLQLKQKARQLQREPQKVSDSKARLKLDTLPVFKSNLMSTVRPFDVQASRQLFQSSWCHIPALAGFRKGQRAPDMPAAE